MDAAHVLNTIKEAVLDYAPLSSWCRLHYDKDLEVYIDRYDYEPGDDDLPPLVVIRREVKRQGYNRSARELEINLFCKLQDSEATTSAYDNLNEGEGTTRIDEFTEYLESALAAMDLGSNYMVFGFEVYYHPAAELSEWSAIIRLTVQEPVCIGQGLFA